MSEFQLVILSFTKIVWIAVFGLLYAIGGRKQEKIKHGKVIRRVFGALWLGTGIILFSYLRLHVIHWPYLINYLTYFGSLTCGYGANTLYVKLRRRALFGFLMALASGYIAFHTDHWLLFGLQFFVSISTSIVLGVFNPILAPEEETVIAVSGTYLVLFMV